MGSPGAMGAWKSARQTADTSPKSVLTHGVPQPSGSAPRASSTFVRTSSNSWSMSVKRSSMSTSTIDWPPRDCERISSTSSIS